MSSKIRNRLASQQGFTLIELLVVIVILGVLVAIAVPSYLSFRDKATTAAAEANVRSAIPAAESFYNDPSTGNGTYANINGAALRAQAPGVSPDITAAQKTNDSSAYCIQDAKVASSTYHYEGGNGGASVIATGACPAGYDAQA